jgi:hypothetical protein
MQMHREQGYDAAQPSDAADHFEAGFRPHLRGR